MLILKRKFLTFTDFILKTHLIFVAFFNFLMKIEIISISHCLWHVLRYVVSWKLFPVNWFNLTLKYLSKILRLKGNCITQQKKSFLTLALAIVFFFCFGALFFLYIFFTTEYLLFVFETLSHLHYLPLWTFHNRILLMIFKKFKKYIIFSMVLIFFPKIKLTMGISNTEH